MPDLIDSFCVSQPWPLNNHLIRVHLRPFIYISNMKPEERVAARAAGHCELCKSTNAVALYEVQPQDGRETDNCIMICQACKQQIEREAEVDSAHWAACLGESMWSEVPGVQVVSWRMLTRLRNESWAAEYLDMMYLDDERLAWARATGEHENDASVQLHRDCNGAQLLNGDTVVLVKSLDVKGSTVNAKVGTVIRNIRLVADNTEQIEGRIEGQLIVILTKYLRKQHK